MSNKRGFSEVELLVSLTIFTFGVLGGVTLMGSGYRYQGQSKLETEMTVLAEMKVEELRAVAGTNLPDTVALLPGGDLVAEAAGYFDNIQANGWIFRRRWEIVSGPAGTRRVTVRVQPIVPAASGSTDISATLLHD